MSGLTPLDLKLILKKSHSVQGVSVVSKGPRCNFTKSRGLGVIFRLNIQVQKLFFYLLCNFVKMRDLFAKRSKLDR